VAGPIVVAGEALMDLVLHSDGSLMGHPGGGPYNVARTVGRLEQPVLFLGRISTDGFGVRLRRELEADAVGTETVVATDAPTTLAVAELDETGGAEYRFYADSTSAPGLQAEDAASVLPPRVGSFYLGTLGLVFEPMATTLEAIVRDLPDDTLIALDPNCRPTTIDDPATYRGKLDSLLRRTDVIKASEDDLAWLRPGTAAVDAARALLSPNAAVALVTLGERGALVVTPEEVVEIAAPRVEVVDTIGAGDAFMGAFLAYWRARDFGRADLTRSGDVGEAARFACRVAAITCSRAGADPPRRSDLPSHG
jgi:fructokinase